MRAPLEPVLGDQPAVPGFAPGRGAASTGRSTVSASKASTSDCRLASKSEVLPTSLSFRTAARGFGELSSTVFPPVHVSRLDLTNSVGIQLDPRASRAAGAKRLQACVSSQSRRRSLPGRPSSKTERSSRSTQLSSSWSPLPRFPVQRPTFAAALTRRVQSRRTSAASRPLLGNRIFARRSATASKKMGIEANAFSCSTRVAVANSRGSAGNRSIALTRRAAQAASNRGTSTPASAKGANKIGRAHV